MFETLGRCNEKWIKKKKTHQSCRLFSVWKVRRAHYTHLQLHLHLHTHTRTSKKKLHTLKLKSVLAAHRNDDPCKQSGLCVRARSRVCVCVCICRLGLNGFFVQTHCGDITIGKRNRIDRTNERSESKKSVAVCAIHSNECNGQKRDIASIMHAIAIPNSTSSRAAIQRMR